MTATRNPSTALSFTEIFSRKETEKAILADVRSLVHVHPGQIDARDESGNTMLHHAVWGLPVYFEVASFLIKKGANYTIENKKGKTAACMAWDGDEDSQKNRYKLVLLLLRKGAKFTEKNEETGDTILHWAAKKNHRDVVEMLLEDSPNIDINAKNDKGETPLDVAVPEMISFLLSKGACNGQGDTDITEVVTAQSGRSTRHLLWAALLSGDTGAQLIKLDTFVYEGAFKGRKIKEACILFFAPCQPLWDILDARKRNPPPKQPGLTWCLNVETFEDLLTRYYQHNTQSLQEKSPDESKENESDKVIVLADCYWEPCKLSSLFQYLQKNNIAHLKIPRSSWSNEGWLFFLDNLVALPLRSLDLSDCRLDDEKLISLANVLANRPSLETCVLDRNQMSSARFKEFINVIKSNAGLKQISVCQQKNEEEARFNATVESTMSGLKKDGSLLKLEVITVKQPELFDEEVSEEEEEEEKKHEDNGSSSASNGSEPGVAASQTSETTAMPSSMPSSVVGSNSQPTTGENDRTREEKKEAKTTPQPKKNTYSILKPLACTGVATLGLFGSASYIAAPKAVGSWALVAKMCAFASISSLAPLVLCCWAVLLGVSVIWLGRNLYANYQARLVSEFKTLPMCYDLKNASRIPGRIVSFIQWSGINTQDPAGNTLLHVACNSLNTCFGLALYLIKNDASYNIKNNEGKTAVYYLLDDLKSCALEALPVIKLLLTKGAMFTEKSLSGKTLLHWAAKHDYIDILKKALEIANINANEKDLYGNIALHCAQSTDVVKMLIEIGKVDINAKNDAGKTILDLALHDIESKTRTRDMQMIRFLLVRRACVGKEEDFKPNEKEESWITGLDSKTVRLVILLGKKSGITSEHYQPHRTSAEPLTKIDAYWLDLWKLFLLKDVEMQIKCIDIIIQFLNQHSNYKSEDVSSISVLLFSSCQPLWDYLDKAASSGNPPSVKTKDIEDLLSRYYEKAIQRPQQDAQTEKKGEGNSLMLSDCYWEPCKLPSLGKCLSEHKITHLKISESRWTEEGWDRFLETLATLPNLHLDLINCELDQGKLSSLQDRVAGRFKVTQRTVNPGKEESTAITSFPSPPRSPRR